MKRNRKLKLRGFKHFIWHDSEGNRYANRYMTEFLMLQTVRMVRTSPFSVTLGSFWTYIHE